MATDKLGETIDLGDNYILCGIVRRVDGNNVVVITGLNGEHAVRVKNNEVVRLDSMSSVAYVDQQINLAIVLASSLFQPLDATLTALAGVATAADRVPYFTGTDTATYTGLTSAGRALIDDATAADQRTTLGLGALATLATVGTSQIDNDAVTFAKLLNSAAAGCSVIGRSTNSAGDFAEIAAGSDNLPLRRVSNALAFGTLLATAALTVSATDKVLGRATAGSGAVEEIACTSQGRGLMAISGALDGDLLYYSGGWQLLKIGTAGDHLVVGDGGVPAWQTP